MNNYIQIAKRSSFDRRVKQNLRTEVAALQKVVLGMFAVSLVVNMAQYAHIISLEDTQKADEALWQADAALYEKCIEQAQRERDRAIDELGTLTASVEADKKARAEQARAYEAVGEYTYMGIFQTTAYCPCEKCCGKWADGLTATGLPAEPGIVAVDPGVIPLGSTVIIDGQKYLAADTGVTGHHVDVCMADHAATVEAGVGTAEVWIVCAE